MAEEQKKRGRTGRRVTTAAAAAALLLLAGNGVSSGGWGLLPGKGDTLLPEQEQVQAVETAEEKEPETPADDGVLTVSVHENQISFEGEAVSPGELEEALLRAYEEGKEVELVDDGAIKADYDAAAAILDKLNIPYAAR